jgi:hypothetical protein
MAFVELLTVRAREPLALLCRVCVDPQGEAGVLVAELL